MALLILLLLCLSSNAAAQLTSPSSIKIDAGMSIPNAPDQFYDYWNNGFNVRISSIYASVEPYAGFISVEFNLFTFDNDQFFKKLNMNGNTTSINGASTFISQLSGGSYYFFAQGSLN